MAQVFDPSVVHVDHPRYGQVTVLPRGDFISDEVSNGRVWEEELCGLMAGRYIDGTDMLDVGANMGFSALGMSLTRSITGTVHAFEAQFRMCTLLSYNLRHLPSTKVYNCGVDERTGEMLSYIVDAANVGATRMHDAGEHSRVYVPTVALDDLHAKGMFPRRISVVKVDVEGHEERALSGMRALLEEHRPTLFVEAWPQNIERVTALLAGMRYELAWHKLDDTMFLPLPPNQA